MEKILWAMKNECKFQNLRYEYFQIEYEKLCVHFLLHIQFKIYFSCKFIARFMRHSDWLRNKIHIGSRHMVSKFASVSRG